jgi:hypothetical protein
MIQYMTYLLKPLKGKKTTIEIERIFICISKEHFAILFFIER